MENNPVYKDNAEEDDASVEEVTPTAEIEIEVEAFSFGDLLASSAESAVKEEEKTEGQDSNCECRGVSKNSDVKKYCHLRER
eukprot:scaffold2457_cov90-Skeletonema_marinoi.AAC.1